MVGGVIDLEPDFCQGSGQVQLRHVRNLSFVAKDGKRSVATDSLTNRVTNYIFDHIGRNQLSAGEYLPSEVKTSTELNISRGIVREAFRSLEVTGIIEKE